MHSGTFMGSKDQDVDIFGWAVLGAYYKRHVISVCPMTDNVHFGHLSTVVPSDFSIFVTSLPFVINKYFV